MGAAPCANLTHEKQRLQPAISLCDRTDPKYVELELRRGALEGLGGAPDAAGVTVSGQKLENTKLSAVPVETTS